MQMTVGPNAGECDVCVLLYTTCSNSGSGKIAVPKEDHSTTGGIRADVLFDSQCADMAKHHDIVTPPNAIKANHPVT